MPRVRRTIAGPASVAYGVYPPSICGSLLFGARAQIVSVCPGASGPQARIINPQTLRVSATYTLPGGAATSFQDFTGGGYIYLDQHSHLWTTTRDQHLYELAIGAHGFRRIADDNPSKVLARGDGITSALPDFRGNVWFVTRPGQVDAGSGTTPAILPGGYTAITDNADPMDVVVYRTAARLRRGQRRMVCRVPVFGQGASDTENSLIASGRSLVVENNYGYAGYSGVDANAQTAPGFARVEIDRDGHRCHRVWQTNALAAPSVVPKLSLKTGLIYTYVREPGPVARWAWAALSLRTGRTAFTVPTGGGTLYNNNNYASISLGPTGNAYLATIGGITELRRR